MDIELLRCILADIEVGKSGVLCTIIAAHGSVPREAGTSLWVTDDGVSGTVGGGIAEYEAVQKARDILCSNTQTALLKKNFTAEEGLACGGSIELYFEKIGNEPELFIFGGGHVGRSLAKVAPLAGFRITVWDDRDECVTEAFFPHARRLCCPLDVLFSPNNGLLYFHRNVYCIAVTRGHRYDADVIRALYGKTVAYIGMIGSEKKNSAVTAMLSSEGLPKQYLESVYKPIGLPIEAQTPEEIAIAITAELIAVRRGGDVKAIRKPYQVHEPENQS